MGYYCIVCLFIFYAFFKSGLSVKLNDQSSQTDTFGVKKLGDCAVDVKGFGVINLEPLKRTDGYPRFYTVYKSSVSISSQTWNYTFNPCQPYNEPYNPHQNADNKFGDGCTVINVCKFNQEGRRSYHYQYGVQNSESPVFDGHLDKDTGIPNISITYSGASSMETKKTRIHLKCDMHINDPDDGLFIILYDKSDENGIEAELHHMCCCPGVCENGLPAINQSTKGVVKTPGGMQQAKKYDSKKILFIVGVNLLILILGGCVGITCYRKKTHLQFYYKLPGVQSLPSSQYAMTLGGSNDHMIETDTRLIDSRANDKPTAFRDYETDANRMKKKLQIPVLENCLISNNNLELSQRLGGGIYSDTNAGNYSGINVAVTRITLSIHDNQMSKETLNWMKEEVWILSRQRHRHIVSILGICTENRFPYIISEFVDGQSVKYFIQNNVDSLTWPQRVKICLQAADGMAYLHSTKPAILHRDLRCANIFVNEHGTVKVADFGLIKLIQPLREICVQKDCCCQGQYSACPSSIRWTAPEILRKPDSLEQDKDSPITPMSDVYSFGMVMWEMAVCEDPFGDITTEKEVIQKVIQGARPDTGANNEVMPMYRTLMHTCWNSNPENRPKFKQVATRLKELISQARSYQKNIANRKKIQTTDASSTTDIKHSTE